MTVRIVRTLLGSSIEADGGGARTSKSLKTLIALLHTWGAISADTRDASVRAVCRQALGDGEQNGSAAALIASGREIGRGLRDRMAVDFWRIANAPAALVGHAHVEAMLETCNQLIDRLSALSGLAAENMGRSPAWRFYDLGRRLERAVNACRIARKLGGDNADHDALSVLLDLNDSQIIYRTRYLTGPVRAPVLDLTLLDPQNPRSLHFQLTRIEDHLRRLPSLSKVGLVEPQLRAAKSVLSMVETLDADDIDDAWMQDVETHLLALSDTLSQRYFLQYEKAEKTVMDPFLA